MFLRSTGIMALLIILAIIIFIIAAIIVAINILLWLLPVILVVIAVYLLFSWLNKAKRDEGRDREKGGKTVRVHKVK